MKLIQRSLMYLGDHFIRNCDQDAVKTL